MAAQQLYHEEAYLADAAVLTSAKFEDERTSALPSTKYEDEKTRSSLEVDEKGTSSIHNEDDFLEVSGSDDDPEYNVLPMIVRELCDFDDDPNTPVMTWRFFFLSAIFTALGAFLVQLGFFRTTYVPYSIYFVQIASLFFGRFLARVLPQKTIGWGRFTFELNPGEFSVKEHVAIVLAANTGGSNNLGDYVLAPLAVFYDKPMNGWLAILFMVSAVFIGFSYATLARAYLIENPNTMFPLTLQQVSVFKAMRGAFEKETPTSIKQMRVFWYGILIFFVWEFFPEYIFPFTSSLSIFCWVSSNPNVVFAGSGLGGAGILNISLDWSNIGSTFIYYPYWTQVNMFIGSVITAWILVPICYYTGAWSSDIYPVQSQSLRVKNGSLYPTAAMLTSDYQLNVTLFEQVGVPMMSAQLRWAYFASYAGYIGAFVSLVLFQGPEIWASFRTQWKGKAFHDDKLTKIIRTYPQVPIWWNIALFIFPFIVLLVLTVKGVLYMPIYTLFIGLLFGVVIVIPMGYVYAISGYQLQVGYFNEIVYGYMINAGGSRHPVGSLSYRVISGQCWYEACSMLSDMKLGHYFHIPPRVTLLAQIWGICIGVPVNYATILWVCSTKGGFLDGTETDPLNQWTGQTVISLNNQGITYALIGPKLLFADPIYAPMLYGFLVGALATILLYILHRTWPRARFDLWNVAIFANVLENYYGNVSNFFFLWFILGSVNHLYLKRYKYAFWKTYAYLAGAAADTGYNLTMLFIFVAFAAAKPIAFPHWWGNNADSVERCFPSS